MCPKWKNHGRSLQKNRVVNRHKAFSFCNILQPECCQRIHCTVPLHYNSLFLSQGLSFQGYKQFLHSPSSSVCNLIRPNLSLTDLRRRYCTSKQDKHSLRLSMSHFSHNLCSFLLFSFLSNISIHLLWSTSRKSVKLLYYLKTLVWALVHVRVQTYLAIWAFHVLFCTVSWCKQHFI